LFFEIGSAVTKFALSWDYEVSDVFEFFWARDERYICTNGEKRIFYTAEIATTLIDDTNFHTEVC
jgi:hypothetical protein